MKKIEKVGVVGAGTMGSALAQKFAQEGFKVILADRAMEYVEKGINGIKSMLNEGVERKVFKPEQVDLFLNNLSGTADLNNLKDCDIVIEAIFEDFNAKSDLFKNLSNIVAKDCVLATNTSSFSVTELSESVTNPERFIGLHYFYHAAKNRLVEIIPGKKTNDEVVKAVYRFSIKSGKDPIFTKDAYGFAVNRFFVPWLNESCKLLGEGIATIEQIDAVCMKTFGIGMGPFALMNATGVPIALHAQKTLESFGNSYKVSERLEEQVNKKENWPIGDLSIEVDEPTANAITERMLGCVFFVCNQILEEKVCTPIDLNKGAKIGLRWRKGPIDLMKQYGLEKVNQWIDKYVQLYNEQKPAQLSSKDLELEYITLTISSKNAIITFNRPEDLNALNEEVVKQLDDKFSKANAHPDVEKIIITGSGKAFVAGADIKFFVKNIKNNSLDIIVEFTKYGQEVFEKIDQSPKKVIAFLNGMALGGGMELALCADEIYAVKKATIAFPETGIGIYPGLGGTFRTTRRVGKGLAKYLVLTGQMLSAQKAFEIGLIDGILTLDEMFDVMDGIKDIPKTTKPPLNDSWKAIADFYNNNHYEDVLKGNIKDSGLLKEEIEKIAKTMSYKAPIAMKFAEELIDSEGGATAELSKLTDIFSTKDALLGLSSIGKKVEYKGE